MVASTSPVVLKNAVPIGVVTRLSNPLTVPDAPFAGLMVTVMVAVLPGPTMTGEPAGAVGSTAAR